MKCRTALPWKAIGSFVGTDEIDSQTIAHASNHRNRKPALPERDLANAEFIVEACNNYYKLVSAINAFLDATDDGDVQEVGGEPLEAARLLAEKALR